MAFLGSAHLTGRVGDGCGSFGARSEHLYRAAVSGNESLPPLVRTPVDKNQRQTDTGRDRWYADIEEVVTTCTASP
jgi:hypothetical protein